MHSAASDRKDVVVMRIVSALICNVALNVLRLCWVRIQRSLTNPLEDV